MLKPNLLVSAEEVTLRHSRNVILSDSEGSRFLNHRQDSSVALLLQNDVIGIFRHWDTILRFFSANLFKKNIAGLFILFAFLSTGISFAQERFIYDSGGKPDPFTPWVTADGRLQILISQEKKNESELELEGIIFDKYGLSYAMVNGVVVKIGDIIDGYQVLKVEEKRVIFIKDGELKEVAIKEDEI